MDISARAISLADRPQLGHLGHQCSHAPGRPNLHLVSSSRRPRRAGNSITCERSRSSQKLIRLEGSTVSKNAPRDARELVGKGDGEHVVMQPLLGGLNPRPEPVALPSGRFHFYKNDPCCLHEQDAQVAIAPLRYFFRGWCGPRSRFASEPALAMRQSRDPWRSCRRSRSRRPWRWR